MPPAKVDKSIKNYLLDFGLTEKEVKLYLTLLKSGPNTIMNLARETGIKRSTTHNNIEELIKKGLVSQTNYGERRMVVAEHPEKLTFLMDQKRWDVKKLEEILPDVITRIVETVPEAKETTKVEVKYYEGDKGIKYAYEQILKANEVFTFLNVDKLKTNFSEYIGIFADELKKRKDYKMFEIIEHHSRKSEDEDDYKLSNYKFKYVPSGITLNDTDISIYDNSIALLNIQSGKSSAIIINSQSLAEALKNIHQMVWRVLS